MKKNFIKTVKKHIPPAPVWQKLWSLAKQQTVRDGNRYSPLAVCADFVFSKLRYGCKAEEYFQYNFFFLNRQGKRKFLTSRYMREYVDGTAPAKQRALLYNKETCLDYFKEYVGRDWCGCRRNCSAEAYEAFFRKHSYGVIKRPQSEGGGRDVEFAALHEKFKDAKALRDYCLKNRLIVEEVIRQHEVLNALNPSSVNTLRIITLQGKLLAAELRMGVDDSKVDNAFAGGIYAQVDPDSGIIMEFARRDYSETRYVHHPTTNAVIPGTVIPFWRECRAMVESAGQKVPEVYLIGWDVAVTPEGPVLVEANSRPRIDTLQPGGVGWKYEFKNRTGWKK